MAHRNFDHPWVLGKKMRLIYGSFATNGSSAVDQTSIKGKGIASVTRNSAGNFTVTLSNEYRALIASTLGLACSTNTDLYAQFGAFSNVGSATGAAVSFVIRLLTGSTETDMAANAANRVSFCLVFEDSSY